VPGRWGQLGTDYCLKEELRAGYQKRGFSF